MQLLDPTQHPLSFQFSPCHQHYHYSHFASYSLISDGAVRLVGHKQAFCLEDTRQELVGQRVRCMPRYNCTTPGISRGWSDYYGADLDCQVDATTIHPLTPLQRTVHPSISLTVPALCAVDRRHRPAIW